MNIAIIDDVYEDCKLLTSCIEIYFAHNCIDLPFHITSYQNEEDFLNDFTKDSHDFIFIDYYLRNHTGLDLAKKIRAIDASVVFIFITVSRDFAIESYKVKASGYLVKPIIYEEFAEIMSLIDYKKIREKRFIEISNGNETIKILIKNIICCDIVGHYTRIHLSNKRVEKCRISFSKFQHKLLPYNEFLQCYRGCIINMLQIKKVEDLAFIMSNGEYIPFRKKEKSEILKSYSDFLFEVVRNNEL